MAYADIDGLKIAYDVIGDGRRTWALTPGGRFSKDTTGVRELARSIAESDDARVVVWDRPNCGESDVCFTGSSESVMQADTLAGLLRHLDMPGTVIIGGSGGSRVSLLTAARHPDVASALAMWWVSGGVFGLMSLGTHYCGENVRAAWFEGMEGVAALPEWSESIERNEGNRDRILAQDRDEFITTMERWMLAYCPCGDEFIPGLPDEDARRFELPTLVLRSGKADLHHRRETSEHLADLLPNARLAEPPWGDNEWNERSGLPATAAGRQLFSGWPALAPILVEWAQEVLGR